MEIDLTHQQAQQIRANGSFPVRMLDSETGEAFFLFDEETMENRPRSLEEPFERIRESLRNRSIEKRVLEPVESNLCQEDASRIRLIIQSHAAALEELAMQLAIESAGVSQATQELRNALDLVEQHLDQRQHEKVANLGYRDVSSSFIFLQRTMGFLLSAAHSRSSLISEIAHEAHMAYEQIEPEVARWEQEKANSR